MDIGDKKMDTKNIKLTLSQQEVIDYIKQNRQHIIHTSIQDLSKATYTSNATIIRLCQKLGFKGFKDFKLALIKEIESQKYINQSVDFSLPFFRQETTPEIINNISSLYKESIDLINTQLDISYLEEIITVLIQSQRLFIYAIGDSKITAMNFINKLMKLNSYPILATENYEEIHMSANTSHKDCALFLSYSGTHSTYKKCLQILKQHHCKTIVITAHHDSFLYQYCDYHLLIPDKEHEQKIATFYSQLTFHYILSIIYSLIYAKKYPLNP